MKSKYEQLAKKIEITQDLIKEAQKDLAKASERDNFMDPEEAKAFGLIDHVVSAPGDKAA